jgi:hypothetical protein
VFGRPILGVEHGTTISEMYARRHLILLYYLENKNTQGRIVSDVKSVSPFPTTAVQSILRSGDAATDLRTSASRASRNIPTIFHPPRHPRLRDISAALWHCGRLSL